MKLKMKYSTEAEIPEGFQTLYENVDGAFILTGVEGVKSEDDVMRVKGALDKERKLREDAEKALKKYDGIDPEKVREDLARIPELEAAAGKMDETKIEEIVSARLKRHTNPLERDLAATKELLAQREAEVGTLRGSIKTRDLLDQVRKTAAEMKVRSEALMDIELLAPSLLELSDDGVVVTKATAGQQAGLDLKSFFQDQQVRRPHWWPESVGGGSRGSGGGGVIPENPWSKSHWNMTNQMAYISKHGEEAAKRAASSVGSTVDAIAPPA